MYQNVYTQKIRVSRRNRLCPVYRQPAVRNRLCPVYRQPARSANTTGLHVFSLIDIRLDLGRSSGIRPSIDAERHGRRLSDVGDGPGTCIDHLVRWTTATRWSDLAGQRLETTRSASVGDLLASNSQPRRSTDRHRCRNRLAARRPSGCETNFGSTQVSRRGVVAPRRRRPSIAVNVDPKSAPSLLHRSCRRGLASSEVVSPVSRSWPCRPRTPDGESTSNQSLRLIATAT